jgi:hypothetical protein
MKLTISSDYRSFYFQMAELERLDFMGSHSPHDSK